MLIKWKRFKSITCRNEEKYVELLVGIKNNRKFEISSRRIIKDSVNLLVGFVVAGLLVEVGTEKVVVAETGTERKSWCKQNINHIKLLVGAIVAKNAT